MKQKKPCNCHVEFDAEIAFKRLSEKQNRLAIIVSELVEKNHAESGDRNIFRQKMLDVLIKIVGGKPVNPGDFPHCCLVGGITRDGDYEWFCSGVLIKSNLVLTAAHCFDPRTSYVVALNTVDHNQLQTAEIISARKMHPHPQYAKYNDVCAMVLSKAATTIPVAVATKAEISNAYATTLVGFGNSDIYSTNGFGIKREVTVNMQSIRRSQDDNLILDESKFGYDSDLEFVAGGNGFDSCEGDSGGPAYITVNNQLKLAGLTSRATPGGATPCGEGGIYSRVDAFEDFINQF